MWGLEGRRPAYSASKDFHLSICRKGKKGAHATHAQRGTTKRRKGEEAALPYKMKTTPAIYGGTEGEKT